jgi:putative DNA methylase
MTCLAGHRTKIVDALSGKAPGHRMYAKLVLSKGGQRLYKPINKFDVGLYEHAEELLSKKEGDLVLPDTALEDGYNTRQAMAWGYRQWRQFFNARQLLSLGLLGAAIKDLPDTPEREALVALFSGVLEFNNLFCSYKGEGTGAVRHMFSHHVLKPERTPIEAHPWGTPASSGAFSTLFKTRLLRALEYKERPHDLVGGERVFDLGLPISAPVVQDYESFASTPTAALLKTGSAASLQIPDRSVDLVVTDPPYFDNVHYSELADFFHSWLRQLQPYRGYPHELLTTRVAGEVQSTAADKFSAAIEAAWRECRRVLRDDGLLAFTFHKSQPTGWGALVAALRNAGLIVTAIQPVKGDMTVAAPKSAAADPSNLDAIVVCRTSGQHPRPSLQSVVGELIECKEAGLTVGWADVQSVVMGAVLATYTDPVCDRSLDMLIVEAASTADRVCGQLGVLSGKLKGQSGNVHAESSLLADSRA